MALALEHFDKDAAKNSLDDFTKQSVESKIQLEHIDEVGSIMELFAFQKMEFPTKWRLLSKKTQDGTNGTSASDEYDSEEAVFTITGFIIEKNLPPYSIDKKDLKRHSLRHQVQMIELTGFGSKRFEDAIDKMQQFDDVFAREIGVNEFQQTKLRSHDGHGAIELMNWVFTPRSAVSGATHIPFTKDEDPHNIMENNRGNELVRCADNVVEYYTTKSGGLTEYRDKQEVYPTKPTVFQVGDMVEVGFSIIGSASKDKFRLRPTVRYILLLDSSHTQNALNKKREVLRSKVPEPKIKRRTGFVVMEAAASKRPRLDDVD